MQHFIQRVVYGALAIVVVVAIVMADVTVSRALLTHDVLDTNTSAGRFLDGLLGPIADSPPGRLMARGSIIPVVFLGVLMLGGIEMRRLLEARGIHPFGRFAMLMSALVFASPWLSAGGVLGSAPHHVEGMFWPVAFLGMTAVGAAILAVLRRQPVGMINDYGATLLMVVYLGFLPSFALQLRSGVDVPRWEGAWLLVVTLLVIKASDIGAYLVGTAIGRHKLIPSISPGKSVEGMFGGLLGSVVMAVGLVALGSMLITDQSPAPKLLLAEMTGPFARQISDSSLSPFARAVVFGLIMSALAQFGDLVESGFKRDAGIKDSGHVIPRFGGILDLIDSPVLALPVAWFLLTACWAVV